MLVTHSLVLAIFCFLVVSIFIARRKAGGKTSALLLIVFLISIALTLANFLLVTSGAVVQIPALAFLGNTVGLCAAPSLYLYARSLAERNFQLAPSMGLHFLPVLLILAVVLWAYTLRTADEQLKILNDPTYPTLVNTPVLPLLIFGYVFIYLAAAWLVLSRHKVAFRSQYASDGPSELSWLRISVIGASCIWIGSALHQVIVTIWPLVWLDQLLTAALAISAVLFGSYFLFNSLRQAEHASLPVDLETGRGEKYGEHRLSDSELNAFADSIEDYLENSSAHLQPTISLDALADALPMTARDLSQTINRHFGQTFIEFINQRRIANAIDRLGNEPDTSVTTIMFDSGFSSKSSFYAAFKSSAGVTPGDYRKAVQGKP